MSARPAGRVVNPSRAPARRRAVAVHAHHASDSDAFVVTLLTIFATMTALYDLLILSSLYS